MYFVVHASNLGKTWQVSLASVTIDRAEIKAYGSSGIIVPARPYMRPTNTVIYGTLSILFKLSAVVHHIFF